VDIAGGPITSQPVTANGLIYWGSFDGVEHATDPGTHQDIWRANLGQTTTCFPFTVGITSTAAAASIVINGQTTPVVFVGGSNAQFYALNALTGIPIYGKLLLGKYQSAFIYGSPALYQGSVYIGISSANDCPLVQGKLVQLDATTGTILHSFSTVPTGCLGGGVWGSPAIDQVNGLVVFATGNADPVRCSQPVPYGQAVSGSRRI